MHRYWIITARVITKKDGWVGSRDVPTFLIDSDIQGVSDEAGVVEVAKRVIDCMGSAESVHITAVPMTASTS